MAKKKLVKPVEQTKKYFEYMQVRDYIKAKYKIESGDFWCWLCDLGVISNPGCFSVYRDMFDGWDKDKITDNMKKFLEVLFDEFGPDVDTLDFEVCW